VLFVKMWKMGGCKKVKNRGCFLVKSGPFLNAGCIMYTVPAFVILHFT